MNYEKAYSVLFNAITQAIDGIEQSFVVSREMSRGIAILKEAQQVTEEMYINEAVSIADAAGDG